MTPKSLLRHPMAQSSFNEFENGTTLQSIYPDSIVTPDTVKKLIYCSGKVYYDIFEERKERNLECVIAIMRIEQICPFPYHLVANDYSRFSNVKVESSNNGCYCFFFVYTIYL